MARSGEFALFTFKRARIRTDVDTHGRRLELDSGESLGIVAGSDGVTDVGVGDAGDSDDVAGGDFGLFFAI